MTTAGRERLREALRPLATERGMVHMTFDRFVDEVADARDALSHDRPSGSGLREAAETLLSLIDTANIPRTPTITLARTGTLLEAIDRLRAALSGSSDPEAER